MLECESEDIIQWNSNGLSFRIIDHVRFENELLQKYFKHRKISSMQRQLNAYGFRSVSRGEHKRSFYHETFKRG
ncbi:HSF-type DNA-binding-domain-containing protein, partial [Ochromonadaceae sp. CCMP2298]